MLRVLRFALYALLLVLLIGLLVPVVAPLALNTPAFKGWVAQQAQDRWQRRLSLGGQTDVELFPRPRLYLRDIALSAPGGEKDLLRARLIRLEGSWFALLRGQRGLGHLTLEAPYLQLERRADGTTNADDLLRNETGEPARDWRLGWITVSDGEADLTDAASGAALRFSAISVDAGPFAPEADGRLRVALSVEQPAGGIRGSMKLVGTHRMNLEAKTGELNGLQGNVDVGDLATRLQLGKLAADGNALTVRLERLELEPVRTSAAASTAAPATAGFAGRMTLHSAEWQGDHGTAKGLEASLRVGEATELSASAPELALSPRRLAAATLALTANHNSGEARLHVETAGPAWLSVTTREAELAPVTGTLKFNHPRLRRELETPLAGRLAWHGTTAQTDLTGTLDGAAASVRIAARPGAKPHVDAQLARLNADTLFKPSPDKAPAWNPEVLKDLPVTGQARIGQLTLAGLRARDVRLVLGTEGEARQEAQKEAQKAATQKAAP